MPKLKKKYRSCEAETSNLLRIVGFKLKHFPFYNKEYQRTVIKMYVKFNICHIDWKKY